MEKDGVIMDRKNELLKLAGDNPELTELVPKMLFLEKRLEELEKLPFIRVNPNNPEQQKTTPAAKQYKELLQQYTNCIKILSRSGNVEDSEDESPLRKWVKNHVEI